MPRHIRKAFFQLAIQFLLLHPVYGDGDPPPPEVLNTTRPGLVEGAQAPADVTSSSSGKMNTKTKTLEFYELLSEPKVSIPEELEFQAEKHEGLIKHTPFDPLYEHWDRFNENLHKKYGLFLGAAYTTLYQKASSGITHSEAYGGDFDFFGVWTLADNKAKHPSSIGFLTETRHKFTAIPPNQLGRAIGSLWGTVNTYTVQDYALIQLWWEYQFINNKFGFRLGKLDLTDYFDLYRFISSDYSFLNEGLSANVTIPFPPNCFGIIFGGRPIERSLLLVTIADMNARKTSMSPDTFFTRKEYFSAIQFKWIPKFAEHGKSHYHVMFWHADARKKERLPSAKGVSFVLEQEFKNGFVPFVRYGYQDGHLTEVQQMLSSGFGFLTPFKRKDDEFSVGFVWGRPHEKGKRDQFITETYYRLQLTPHIQVTPDWQMIINPTRNPDHDLIGVFSIRVRIEA